MCGGDRGREGAQEDLTGYREILQSIPWRFFKEREADRTDRIPDSKVPKQLPTAFSISPTCPCPSVK